MEWISVKDKLPEARRSIIVYMPKVETFKGMGSIYTTLITWTTYDNEDYEDGTLLCDYSVGFSPTFEFLDGTISHWMYYPEPPEEYK